MIGMGVGCRLFETINYNINLKLGMSLYCSFLPPLTQACQALDCYVLFTSGFAVSALRRRVTHNAERQLRARVIHAHIRKYRTIFR